MATEKLNYLVTADTKGFSGPIKAIAALAVTAFVAAVKVTAEFEKELSKLRAVSGANEEEMGKLEKKARDLGKSTAFTAKEVASLQFELAKLGFTTNDILNSSGGVLDLAAGLGATLSDAAVLTGSTLRSFSLTTEETGRVVDVLAKAAASSTLDFGKLTESLKDAAPIAKLYNFTLEETVAMLGILANRGIHGSKAGVALRNIFLELDKKGVSFAEALDKVNKSANPAAEAMRLVGKRSAAALSIIAQNQGKVDALATELNNANGAAGEMRETMEDNLIGDFDKLKSAVSELGIQMGETTEGPLRGMTQELTTMVGAASLLFSKFNKLKGYFNFLRTGGGFLNPGQSQRNQHKQNSGLNIIGGPGSGSGGGSSSGGGGTTTSTSNNTVGGGGGGGGLFPDDFDLQFLEEEALELQSFAQELDNVRLAADGAFGDAWWTNTVNAFDINMEKIKVKGEETTKALEFGWVQVGLAVASAVGSAASSAGGFKNLGKSLLGALGSLLIAIGTAALLANTALKVFGIEISTGAAIGAIAFGTTLNALAGGGGSSAASGASGSARSATTATTTTPSSIQGNGLGERLVASVSGQDLRFVLQGANETYLARN